MTRVHLLIPLFVTYAFFGLFYLRLIPFTWAIADGRFSYFHTNTKLSHLIKHLDDVSFTFVAVFDSQTTEDRFSEYQVLAEQLTELPDFNVHYIIHDSKRSLAENIFTKFKINGADLPLYLLFRKSEDQPVTYRGSWKADDIRRWLSLTTGLSLPLPGCVASLDSLARDAQMANITHLTNYLLPAFRHVISSQPYSASEFAHYYGVIAENLVKVGKSYITQESTRLKKLIDSEVADWQKAKLKMRLNILTRFLPPVNQKQSLNDEL